MIEIRKVQVKKNLSTYMLFVDGEAIEDESGLYIRRDKGPVGPYLLAVYTRALANNLAARQFSDISSEIKHLELHLRLALIKGEDNIFLSPTVHRGDSSSFSLSLHFNFHAANWKRLWSVREYAEEFRRVFDSLNTPPGVRWAPEDGSISLDPIVHISFPVGDADSAIGTEAQKHSEFLNQLHELTVISLTSKLRGESVVMQFDFPEEVRVPCEQYLLYFVQFLKDLGVEATAELQHRAGEVLFAVTPKNKAEALDKIRSALEDYLRLAANPVNTTSVLGTEIEVQRLAANIQHLQGQLTLAHAVLQAKDATIQLQQTTIDQQRYMLSGEIMFESVKNVTPKPGVEDKEEVLGGLAEITKYEGKGFNLNLPEAYRRIKKKFDNEG